MTDVSSSDRHRAAREKARALADHLGVPYPGDPPPDDEKAAPLECCGRTFKDRSGLSAHQRSARKCAQHPDYDPDADERGPTQATILIGLATDADDVEYWHDADMVAWATIPVADHVEHHRLRTRPFKTWLRHRYYATEDASPSSQAVQDTVDHLDGIACFDGDQHDTHVRIAGHDGAVYLDLCDADWRIVEVTATGWRVITAADAPVRFRRRNGMLPLPVPQTGGKLKLLADLVNVADRDWPLVVGCLVDMLRPGRGHPVLWLQGEHGTAKTTTARMLRRTVDPHEADVRRAPRDERDLLLSATNALVVLLDNLSSLPPWLSDALAALSTGSGYATRALYTDDDEVILSASRPTIITGIADVVTAPDLLDRTVLVEPPRITTARRTEAELWADFDKNHPQILGALLDAVSCALRRYDATKLDELPRMADFARWVVAAEPELDLGDGASFMEAYTSNRGSAQEYALEASAVAVAIRGLVADQDETMGGDRVWRGTAGELAAAVKPDRPPKDWPTTGQKMAGELKRLAPVLRSAALIDVVYDELARPRKWTLTLTKAAQKRLGTRTGDGSDGSDG